MYSLTLGMKLQHVVDIKNIILKNHELPPGHSPDQMSNLQGWRM